MMETSSYNNKRLIGELIRGRDSTKKRQNLIRRKTQNDGSVSAQDLVIKKLGSFSDSLSVLTSSTSGHSYPVSDFQRLQLVPVTGAEVKRSRRRLSRAGEAVTRDEKPKIRGLKSLIRLKMVLHGGKYGEKEILNAKSPQSPRCTHKNEGCKALKQVQKLEDGSEMYHITYFGHHTCQNVSKNSQMFSDSGTLSFFLHNFEGTKFSNSPSSPSTITNV